MKVGGDEFGYIYKAKNIISTQVGVYFEREEHEDFVRRFLNHLNRITFDPSGTDNITLEADYRKLKFLKIEPDEGNNC